MEWKLIGRDELDRGICMPDMTGEFGRFNRNLEKIYKQIPPAHRLLCTSKTNCKIIGEGNGDYVPTIIKITEDLIPIFNPRRILRHCEKQIDLFRPQADFLVVDQFPIVLMTFSRTVPIIGFWSDNGNFALGTILRTSLINHGDFLFCQIKKALEGGNISVCPYTCSSHNYPKGSLTVLIQELAQKYNFNFLPGINIEEDNRCYNLGETGNHVVIMYNT